jgi:hypothetical protein
MEFICAAKVNRLRCQAISKSVNYLLKAANNLGIATFPENPVI